MKKAIGIPLLVIVVALVIVLLVPGLHFWQTSSTASADTITIQMYDTANNKSIGYVTATDTKYGLELTPHLTGLTPGLHGFHVHQNPSCDAANGVPAGAAGGHLDPSNTGKHGGPYSDSDHLGDLPALTANADGTATLPVLAPKLTTQLVIGHSLMIHAGGDNYSDTPPLGGGGARFACGVISK